MVQTDAMAQISNAFTPFSNASIHYGCSGVENCISGKAPKSFAKSLELAALCKERCKEFFFSPDNIGRIDRARG